MGVHGPHCPASALAVLLYAVLGPGEWGGEGCLAREERMRKGRALRRSSPEEGTHSLRERERGETSEVLPKGPGDLRQEIHERNP